MNHKFQLSTESTADIPYSYYQDRNVSVIFYSYVIDEKIFEDNMGRDSKSLDDFYTKIKDGKLPRTSQINKFQYSEYFESLLEKGDILHIALGSGVTPSVNGAYEAAKELMEKYPGRKIMVVDSTCASSGIGLLVNEVADLRDQGNDIETCFNWAENNKNNVHHQLFSTDMTMFRRSGRVSGPTAMIASILGICPVIKLNKQGKLISYAKARSKKRAIIKTVEEMETNAIDGINYSGRCYIAHSNCLDLALETKDIITQKFPNIRYVEMFEIGNIIASHCGPGTVAVFFFGKDRTE